MNATPLHLQTPLLESRALGLAAQRTVWLKMEALQPSGSFKLRGIGLATVIEGTAAGFYPKDQVAIEFDAQGKKFWDG